MTNPFLRVVQNLGEKERRRQMGPHPLMLTGIRQDIFLKNWGEPEFQISLKKLGDFQSQGAMYLIVSSDDEADCSILIYKSRDRILFFRKKRLNTHFKWSRFEERRNRFKEETEPNTWRIPRTVVGNALALVA
jgi:hypothetical protein